jgi:hypothetical protein
MTTPLPQDINTEDDFNKSPEEPTFSIHRLEVLISGLTSLTEQDHDHGSDEMDYSADCDEENSDEEILDDDEFMGPVTLRQLFLGVTDQWAQVLKSSALKTHKEELQAYDLLELDALGEELDYDIDSVVGNVIVE